MGKEPIELLCQRQHRKHHGSCARPLVFHQRAKQRVSAEQRSSVTHSFMHCRTRVEAVRLSVDEPHSHFLLVPIEMTASKKSSGAINLNQLAMSIPIRQSLLHHSNRDEFEWSQVSRMQHTYVQSVALLSLQWQSATKAINSTESTVKEKHVRSETSELTISSVTGGSL